MPVERDCVLLLLWCKMYSWFGHLKCIFTYKLCYLAGSLHTGCFNYTKVVKGQHITCQITYICPAGRRLPIPGLTKTSNTENLRGITTTLPRFFF